MQIQERLKISETLVVHRRDLSLVLLHEVSRILVHSLVALALLPHLKRLMHVRAPITMLLNSVENSIFGTFTLSFRHRGRRVAIVRVMTVDGQYVVTED